eukprot:761773-Rhodomonas_salina.1
MRRAVRLEASALPRKSLRTYSLMMARRAGLPQVKGGPSSSPRSLSPTQGKSNARPLPPRLSRYQDSDGSPPCMHGNMSAQQMSTDAERRRQRERGGKRTSGSPWR